MQRYNYRFVWVENGKIKRKYIEAASMERAEAEFEKEFEISVAEKGVHVRRLT